MWHPAVVVVMTCAIACMLIHPCAPASPTFNVGILIRDHHLNPRHQAYPVLALEAFAHAKQRFAEFIPEFADLQNNFTLVPYVAQAQSVSDPRLCVPPVAEIQEQTLWILTP